MVVKDDCWIEGNDPRIPKCGLDCFHCHGPQPRDFEKACEFASVHSQVGVLHHVVPAGVEESALEECTLRKQKSCVDS
jgi:hypothetical protein